MNVSITGQRTAGLTGLSLGASVSGRTGSLTGAGVEVWVDGRTAYLRQISDLLFSYNDTTLSNPDTFRRKVALDTTDEWTERDQSTSTLINALKNSLEAPFNGLVFVGSKTLYGVTVSAFRVLGNYVEYQMWAICVEVNNGIHLFPNGKPAPFWMEDYVQLSNFDPYQYRITHKGFDVWLNEDNHILVGCIGDQESVLHVWDTTDWSYNTYDCTLRETPGHPTDMRYTKLKAMQGYDVYYDVATKGMRKQNCLTGVKSDVAVSGDLVVWDEFHEEFKTIPVMTSGTEYTGYQSIQVESEQQCTGTYSYNPGNNTWYPASPPTCDGAKQLSTMSVRAQNLRYYAALSVDTDETPLELDPLMGDSRVEPFEGDVIHFGSQINVDISLSYGGGVETQADNIIGNGIKTLSLTEYSLSDSRLYEGNGSDVDIVALPIGLTVTFEDWLDSYTKTGYSISTSGVGLTGAKSIRTGTYSYPDGIFEHFSDGTTLTPGVYSTPDYASEFATTTNLYWDYIYQPFAVIKKAYGVDNKEIAGMVALRNLSGQVKIYNGSNQLIKTYDNCGFFYFQSIYRGSPI